MGKYKKLATDTVLFTISSFGSKALSLFLTPLYTSVLTTEQYGIADLITTTINFIYPVFTLAISDATLRFAFDKDKSKNCIFNTSILFVSLSTILLALLYPIFSLVSTDVSTYCGIFIVTYFLFNIQSCFSNFIKGIGYTKLFAIQGVVHTAFILVSNILLLLVFKWGLRGYLYSMIIGYVGSILLMFLGAKLYRYILPFDFDKSILKEMLKYSIPMIPTLVAWSVNTYIDKYMIIYFYGLSESGIYGVAQKIPTIVTTITSIFTQAWQLSVIENFENDGSDHFFENVYRIFNAFMILAVLLFMPFSRLISRILFAEAYYRAWTAVPFLLLSSIFSSLASFLAAAFRATKKTDGLMRSVIVGAFINIALNAVLLKPMGIIGAALATAVSFMFVWIVRVKQVNEMLGINIDLKIDTITYVLIFISALLYSYDFEFDIAVYIVCFLAVLSLNFHSIRNMIHALINLVNKKLHKV